MHSRALRACAPGALTLTDEPGSLLRSAGMQDSTPPTAACNGAAAPERLHSLLKELEELVPWLSEAALAAAARRVASARTPDQRGGVEDVYCRAL